VKRVIVIALALAAAGGAWAALGSVISSFPLDYPVGYSHIGIYVENGYVYFVGDNGLSYPNRICCTVKYTTAGSYVGSGPLDIRPDFPSIGPYAGETSHLGAGYMYIMGEVHNGYNISGVFDLSNGLRVSGPMLNFYHSGAGDIAWDGQYYYLHHSDPPGVFYRTSVGGAESSFVVPGFPISHPKGLAYTNAVAGVGGRYLVCGPSYEGTIGCYIDLATNSVMGTFALNCRGSATVAPGYPPSYGPTLWIEGYRQGELWHCYQIDLGNSGVVNITPASLGRIKAVYR
jgi:hypothetical protein